VIALGVMFALGLLSVAATIPVFTCARGRLDLVLEMCVHPQTRSDPTSWLLLKRAILVVGLVAGVAIAFSRRWVKVSAPLAALAWFGGVVEFLVATKMLHLA
jgi:energy-converting hydrogenase Eha subunit H